MKLATAEKNSISGERYVVRKDICGEKISDMTGDFFPTDFYLMSEESMLSGRFRILVSTDYLAVLEIDQAPVAAPGEDFGAYPTREFTKKFRHSLNNMTSVSSISGTFMVSTVPGAEDRFVFQTAVANYLEAYLGKIVTLSSSQPTDDPLGQFIVVSTHPGDSVTGPYIKLATYLDTTADFYEAGFNGQVELYFWDTPEHHVMDQFFISSKTASLNPGSLYKNLFDVFVGFYFCLMYIDNEDGRYFDWVPTLRSRILNDVGTFEDDKYFLSYQGEEEYDDKYSQHNGLIVFAVNPGELDIYAPYAFENLSILSRVYSPLVGGPEDTVDTPETKNQVQAMMYSFGNGADFSVMENGLNVFGNVPTNLPEETIVVDVVDKEYVEVKKVGDGLVVQIPMNGFPVSQSVVPGVLLSPFEALTKKIEVKDEANNPRWWDLDYISILSPLPEYQAAPFNQEERRVMNEVLKYNAFGVKIDADIISQNGPSNVKSISAFVRELKPTWLHGFLYSKLVFENTDSVSFEITVVLEIRIIINATIFANLRNKYFKSDDPTLDGIDFDISRQNSFNVLDENIFLVENLSSPGIYLGWGERSETFEWEAALLTDPDYSDFVLS
jgi:hypothetical protein